MPRRWRWRGGATRSVAIAAFIRTRGTGRCCMRSRRVIETLIDARKAAVESPVEVLVFKIGQQRIADRVAVGDGQTVADGLLTQAHLQVGGFAADQDEHAGRIIGFGALLHPLMEEFIFAQLLIAVVLIRRD